MREMTVREKVLGIGVQYGQRLGSEDRNQMVREAQQWEMRLGQTRFWSVLNDRLKS